MSEDAEQPSIEEWWSGGETVPVPWGGESGSVDVFVRRSGSGPTVTVLHGWPTSTFDFAPVERLLAGRADLLLVDLVGSGASDKPEGAYPIGRQADVIEAVWARLGIGRTTLLAHDYGTIVAQELLARRREGAAGAALDGVVWLNGSIYPQHYRPTDLQTALVDPEVGPGLAVAVDGAAFAAGFPALFGPGGAPSAGLLAELWRGIARRDGHHRWPQVLGYMAERAANGDRYVAALDAAVDRIPSRFVWGLDDAVSGRAVSDELVRRHPAATVVALEGVGHYPQLERPDAVAEAVLSLLDEVDEVG